MIGIIKKGHRFEVVLDYDYEEKKKLGCELVDILDKKDVVVPVSEEGEYALDVNLAEHCFEQQASLRRRVEKPVCHIALSFDERDASKLPPEFLVQIAREYMQQMGYVNTQYLITRHKNTSNPHVHLIINMIDDEGNLISVISEKKKNTEVCRFLTEKYKLTIGHWKGVNKCEIPIVSEERRMTAIHYEMAMEVTKALSGINTIGELPNSLSKGSGHVVAFFKEENGERQLYFSKTYAVGNESKTSTVQSRHIDKRLSVSNIEKALELKTSHPQIIAEINEACTIISAKTMPADIKHIIAYVNKTMNEPWVSEQSKDIGYMPLYLELARHMQEIIRLIGVAENLKNRRKAKICKTRTEADINKKQIK